MTATLAAPVTFTGIGLFTGADTAVEIHPVSPTETDAGYTITAPGAPAFTIAPALVRNLLDHPAFAAMPPRHTAVAASDDTGAPRLLTTEHLLAALAAAGVYHADIRPTSDVPEVPILDGSADDFAKAIHEAGTTPVDGPAPITPTDTIRIEGDHGSHITIEPSSIPHYRYELEYDDNRLPAQSAEWNGTPEDFRTNIAPARTFSFAQEAQMAASVGLFTRFTPKDLLVLHPGGEPIDNQLRFKNEPARHKLLDLIGDLALTGRPIHARITAHRAGHALNHQAARILTDL